MNKRGLVIRSSRPLHATASGNQGDGPFVSSSRTTNSDGSDSLFAFRWVWCHDWARRLTWCLLNHSCFLLWLQRCPLGRVPSALSPTFSVSGKSPEQQETPTNQLWERCFICICIKKPKKLQTPVSESLLYNVLVRRVFHEQTRKEWHFIPWVMEKSVNFTPVLNCSL